MSEASFVKKPLYVLMASEANHPERVSPNESKDTLIMWYVYILECKDLSLYTGITNNLERRFEEHKNGKGGKFTHAFKVNKLLYSEPWDNKNEALKREAQIKGWTRKKKLALIQGDKELLKKL